MDANRSKKESISFIQTILAGANYSASTALKRLIRTEGNIQRISGIFNSGQQNTLQVRPYLERTGQRIEELITYPLGTNRYLSGDDRVFNIPIDFDVRNGDQIKIDVYNASTFDYTLDISFEVDYVGGRDRVI